METIIDKFGRLTIPESILTILGIEGVTSVQLNVTDDGMLVLKPEPKPVESKLVKKGKWLVIKSEQKISTI